MICEPASEAWEESLWNVPARGTSLLKELEVGGSRVDMRNSKEACLCDEQSHSTPVRITVVFQTAMSSHWKGLSGQDEESGVQGTTGGSKAGVGGRPGGKAQGRDEG